MAEKIDFTDAINRHLGWGGKRHQNQEALDKQLRDLVVIANKNGLYDAADYLRDLLMVIK